MAFYGTASVTFASSVETPEKTANAIALYTVFTMVGFSIATSSAPLFFGFVGFHSLVGVGLLVIIAAAILFYYRAKPIPPVIGEKTGAISNCFTDQGSFLLQPFVYLPRILLV